MPYRRTGPVALLYYMLQQVQQFRSLGEDFAMQHKDSEYLGEVEEELQTAVLEAIPAEKRLRIAAGRAFAQLAAGRTCARIAAGSACARIVPRRAAWRPERGTGGTASRVAGTSARHLNFGRIRLPPTRARSWAAGFGEGNPRFRRLPGAQGYPPEEVGRFDAN